MRINAWIGLLQDDGWINAVMVALGLAPLRLLYTDSAMYIGIVYTYLPFMVLPLYARLSRLDERLLDAAADLGAAPWRVFLSVTLPLSMPGVWAGMLLVFIPAVGEYVIPELLGGPQAQLIGRVLWEEFFQNRDWPTAAAIACALLVLLLLLPAAVVWVIGRSPLPPPLVRFTAQAHKGRGRLQTEIPRRRDIGCKGEAAGLRLGRPWAFCFAAAGVGISTAGPAIAGPVGSRLIVGALRVVRWRPRPWRAGMAVVPRAFRQRPSRAAS
jgi:hypothetical protein